MVKMLDATSRFYIEIVIKTVSQITCLKGVKTSRFQIFENDDSLFQKLATQSVLRELMKLYV